MSQDPGLALLRTLPAVALLAGLGLTIACAGQLRIAGATPQDRLRRELVSEHFRVLTDLDSARAEQTVRQLELARARLLEAVPVDDLPDRIEVRAHAHLQAGDPWHHGRYHCTPGGGEWIELYGLGGREDLRLVIAHEVAHLIAYHSIPIQPSWFAEGYASYLSSVGGPGAAVGGPVQDWKMDASKQGLVPVRELLLWKDGGNVAKEQEAKQERLYGTSWTLVRFLIDERPDALDAYRSRLRRAEAPLVAWNESFPEWALDAPGALERLDPILARYALAPLRPGPVLRAAVEPRIRERLLGDEEDPPLQAGGESRAYATITLDATGRALLVARYGDSGAADTVVVARASVARWPDSPWARLFLAAALPPATAERAAALRKAVELEPWRADVRLFAAAGLLEDEPEEAELHSRRATALAPWAWMAVLVHAEASARLGRCDEALSDLQRSVDLRPWGLSPTEDALTEHLRAALQKTCSDAAGARHERSRP